MTLIHKVFSLAALALLAFILAACGGGGNNTGGAGGNTSSGAANLSQTYTAPDNSITVRLPEGWEAEGGAGSVAITNNKAGLENTEAANEMPADTVFIIYSAFPADQAAAMTGGTDRPALRDLVTPLSATIPDSEGQLGEPADIKFGGKDAVRVNGSSDNLETILIIIDEGENGFAMLSIGTRKGEMSKFEATALAVGESISKP